MYPRSFSRQTTLQNLCIGLLTDMRLDVEAKYKARTLQFDSITQARPAASKLAAVFTPPLSGKPASRLVAIDNGFRQAGQQGQEKYGWPARLQMVGTATVGLAVPSVVLATITYDNRYMAVKSPKVMNHSVAPIGSMADGTPARSPTIKHFTLLPHTHTHIPSCSDKA